MCTCRCVDKSLHRAFDLFHRRWTPQHTQPQVRRVLSEHECQPSLLHGDLWTGNVGATEEDEPVIFVSPAE